MRLTRFTDIGLRVLIYLARAGERRVPVTVAEVAAQFELPVNHLVKVVGHLARAGWVSAIRGRNGGLRLAANSATLSIGTVLRALEGDSELVDCEGSGCRLSGDCQLRAALKTGMDAFYGAMDKVTLAHITHGNTGEKIVLMHRMFLDQGKGIAA
ncbi:Rrf2 family transcriptional regulator [Massilia sp. DJPM01]|uniref:RrF2 family transcriptional regulator n=1 Tax=Massilia sp. DJPM01 TaxID=3024404 RepID=UPI00259D387B|nr:Rrf2 family transcriptional regulator [Massilia sp. DJPM01]MDM5177718.1 Rrf2 family transcriptional regulator [Massilia sp. DJPM01]